MITVYALKSLVKKFTYVGFTNDLERRLTEHNAGYNKSTKPYKPFVIIYQEEVSDTTQARKREKYLKSGAGRRLLETYASAGSP